MLTLDSLTLRKSPAARARVRCFFRASLHKTLMTHFLMRVAARSGQVDLCSRFHVFLRQMHNYDSCSQCREIKLLRFGRLAICLKFARRLPKGPGKQMPPVVLGRCRQLCLLSINYTLIALSNSPTSGPTKSPDQQVCLSVPAL